MLNTAIHNRSRTQNTEVLILDATLKNKYIVFAESEDEDKLFWRDIITQFAPEKAKDKCKITVLLNSKVINKQVLMQYANF
jgi:hypothetical protein